MQIVATLIAHPQNPVLDQHIAERAARAISSQNLYWLADSIACDIPLPADTSCEAARAELTNEISGLPIDIVIQPAETRRKRALVADMDSTMIDQECIDELAATIKIKDQIAAITARAMNGEIEFEAALRERVALLEGLDIAVVDEVIAKQITLASGGQVLVQTMRANGAYTALVSGGFTVFTSRISQMIGFQEDRANTLLEDGGRLTGKVAEPILGSDAKVRALTEVAENNRISLLDCLAVGDGANDLAMLKIAGTGIALHAKPSVANAAQHRIDYGDLTALLYVQGYRKSDFAE